MFVYIKRPNYITLIDLMSFGLLCGIIVYQDLQLDPWNGFQ